MHGNEVAEINAVQSSAFKLGHGLGALVVGAFCNPRSLCMVCHSVFRRRGRILASLAWPLRSLQGRT